MAIAPGIRAVFFDAVGTLIHPAPPAPTVYAEIGRRFGSRLTSAEIGPRFRQAFDRQEQCDRDNRLRTSEPRELERWRQIVAEVLPDLSDPAACFTELFAHFARPDGWRCEPDAESTMRSLAGRGFMLGLASNYDRRLRPVATVLLPMLERIVISSEVGWRKPAPEFFAALCRSVDFPADEILYVGDDFANDYEGARSAGLSAVLFDPEGKSDGDVPRVSRLGDLLKS